MFVRQQPAQFPNMDGAWSVSKLEWGYDSADGWVSTIGITSGYKFSLFTIKRDSGYTAHATRVSLLDRDGVHWAGSRCDQIEYIDIPIYEWVSRWCSEWVSEWVSKSINANNYPSSRRRRQAASRHWMTCMSTRRMCSSYWYYSMVAMGSNYTPALSQAYDTVLRTHPTLTNDWINQ